MENAKWEMTRNCFNAIVVDETICSNCVLLQMQMDPHHLNHNPIVLLSISINIDVHPMALLLIDSLILLSLYATKVCTMVLFRPNSPWLNSHLLIPTPSRMKRLLSKWFFLQYPSLDVVWTCSLLFCNLGLWSLISLGRGFRS